MRQPINPFDLLLGALLGAATVMFVVSKANDVVSADFMLWRSTVQLMASIMLFVRIWPSIWKMHKPDV